MAQATEEKAEEVSWIDELLDAAAGGSGECDETAGGSGEAAAGGPGEGEVTLAAKISTAVDQLAERAVLKRLNTLSSQLEEKGF